MSSESKRTPIPDHHIVSEFPEVEDKQFLRQAMEVCFNQRAIYRAPQLSDDDIRQVLTQTGRSDILINQMFTDVDWTIDSTPSYLVPTTKFLLYGKAVREALTLYTEKVLIPKGDLTPEGAPNYIKERVHAILDYQRRHAQRIPKDAWEKGIRSYFKIGFYTACEAVEGRPNSSGLSVQVEDRLAPSVMAMY